MSFSERIHKLRKERKLSQDEFAEKAGVSRKTLQNWESGASIPDGKVLITLSDVFDVSIDYLLRGVVVPAEDIPPADTIDAMSSGSYKVKADTRRDAPVPEGHPYSKLSDYYLLRELAGAHASATLDALCLCPRPRTLEIGEGVYHLLPGAYILLDDNALYAPVKNAIARQALTAALPLAVGKLPPQRCSAIRFVHAEELAHEAYALSVDDSGIAITYADPAGAFYGVCTLVQIIENTGRSIPFLHIDDEPVFPTRGYMLDIGRNKVPRREEMFALVDFLSSMKINHVELYIEGIPFEYPSFPHMWQGQDILTGEDILALDVYCRERFIDLVPTQNHFGHMDKWLEKEYRHLSECPDGFDFHGSFMPNPRCLDPLNPESLELVRGLEEDLLPYFSSPSFNICCDETLELGQGHAKEACEAQGLGRVYLVFLLKVIEIAREHGKQVLFWDDIIKHYPELLPEIPSDAIALEWGYLASQPTAADCELMQKTGVRYYTCPGTASWNTLLGKTNQMIANIRNAAEFGHKYGAEGLLNTDWGDSGNLQSPPTAYSGIAYGAAMAWSPDESRDMDLASVLNVLIFKDAMGIMGQLVLDAGNYFEIEPSIPNNITHSFMLLIAGLDAHQLADGLDPAGYARVSAYLDELSTRLAKTDLRCARAALVMDEYRLALALVRLAQDIGLYHLAVLHEDVPAQITHLETLCSTLPGLIAEVRRTWLARNRYSYMDESLQPLATTLSSAREKLAAMKA